MMRASLAFSVHAILATLPFVLGDTTKAISLCTTSYGKTSKNPVPTTTFGLTITSRVTVKTTSTPKQTITPPPTTNTYSTTTTNTVTVTLPQVTDTFTDTDTLTQTCKFQPARLQQSEPNQRYMTNNLFNYSNGKRHSNCHYNNNHYDFCMHFSE